MSYTKPLMQGASAVALYLLLITGASAQAAQQQQQQHRKPPPEALDACKGKSAGQACSFTSPHGQMSGTCFAPQDKPQACRPQHPPEHGDGQGADHPQGGASRPSAKR